MSYQYPESQDPSQVPAFGAQVFWADTGEVDVDYSADALAAHQPLPPKEKESRSSRSSRHKRKESKTYQSGSDTETESRSKMSSRTSKHQSSSTTKREKAPKPPKKTTDDWSEVTDPEERRRIQNKIAQRKFREKAKDNRERSQREAMNQKHASLSYRIPTADELPPDQDELSGLPWGGLGMGVIMAKGHATASQQGSRRESDPPMMDPNAYLSPYGGGYTQMSSWDATTGGGSSGDDATIAGGVGSSHGGAYFATGSGGDDGNSPYYYDYEYDAGGDGSGGYHM